MNKQSYFPINDEIALELIKVFISPGNPPLGMAFAWIQPEDDSEFINVGGLYGQPSNITLRELLQDSDIGYWAAKQIIKESRCMRKSVKSLDEEIEFDSVCSIDNLSIPLKALDSLEFALYRLAIMAINTMTEGHNWACLYLEYLANMHYEYKDDNEWGDFYDGYSDDLLESIDYAGLLDRLYWHIWDSDYYCSLEYKQSTYDNLESLQAEYVLFPDNEFKSYEIEELYQVIAHMINWIQDEWITGNLTFIYDEDMPDKIKKWYAAYESQGILPEFESIERKG